jgi:hypothetical protein
MPIRLWSDDMAIRLKLLAAMCLVASAGTCFASEAYTCPTKITYASASVAVQNMPPGFESLVPASTVSFLTGSNMFNGHPKEEASLMPNFSSPDGKIDRWDFVGDFSRGKWISCDYERGFVRLVKRVDDSAKSCTATTRTLDKVQKTLEIRYECK